jgi:hypothetical protein
MTLASPWRRGEQWGNGGEFMGILNGSDWLIRVVNSSMDWFKGKFTGTPHI